MADYYDALRAKWATLQGTRDEKLAAVNAATVPGPRVDVSVSSVVGKLMLSGAYLQIASFAGSAFTNSPVHDTALASAKLLIALITTPNAPAIQMSDPASYAAVKGMMDAILAQETAATGTTGFTQSVHDTLLALCETTLPWWKATVAQGGGGLDQPVGVGNLNNAGLT